jgi:hypothetical protein
VCVTTFIMVLPPSLVDLAPRVGGDHQENP